VSSEEDPVWEAVEVEGQIVDSLMLAKVLDVISNGGCEYRMLEVEVGPTKAEPSTARFEVGASDQATLDALLDDLQMYGLNRLDSDDAAVVATDKDGVFPEGFYSTTNLPTLVRVAGQWQAVENPEMDCGVVILPDSGVRTVPMHQVRAGDRIVIGHAGVRVEAPSRSEGAVAFEFMRSEVSSEKPKAVLIADMAARVRDSKEAGSRVLAVCGPAVVHTGPACLWPGWSERGGWMCSLRATALPPTTWNRMFSAPRWGSRSGRGRPSKAGTPTTCG
jgi:hypothetical protein